MYRKPTIAFTAFFTTLAMTNVVSAEKQAIMQAYRAFDAAMERKDVNQVYADFAPEYTFIGLNRKLMNLEQSCQFTQQYVQTIRQINVHDEIKQIQINEQTVTVIDIGYTSAIISNLKNPQVTELTITQLVCLLVSLVDSRSRLRRRT